MSSLKAWEVVRTCVLARRWRHPWASAPCVDLRARYSGRGNDPPELFREFVHRLFLFRDASAPVDKLILRSSDEDADFDEDDANTWIGAAIKRNARVIHLAGHRTEIASLDCVPFVSSHLKIVKLSYASLDARILRQLSSSRTSLEELDRKDCLVAGPKIESASLKTLIMIKCKINCDLSIAAPNLILLRIIRPYVRVPSFKNLGSLVTGTIILDDSFLSKDYEHISDEEDYDATTDDDDDGNDHDDYKVHGGSSLSDDDFGYISDDDDDDFDNFGYGHDFPIHGYERSGYKDSYDYGSDIDSDDNTYEYSEIANDPKYGYKGEGQNFSKDGKVGKSSGCNGRKILGGRHILHSLSSAISMEFLTDAGEVVLSRELKSCPTFSNLKTLSLGEWCMTADFDALIFLLQNSPNLERLFLQLKMDFNMVKMLETGIKLQGRPFTCKNLQMVKIRCSKDDARVHKLAHLFRANGLPLGKIYVRRSGNAHLRSQKELREIVKGEMEFFGM
ncbi:hypothetical protein BRADI_1g18335v3 [Brachypodium distachyon]|uniref:FBD domain-containing protein n=2 Tax=Brachypodium distachyon TaxID=15368 RepID=A0A0Q3GUQ7_BRADI|nr:hypothetical protein BRADI_1g18335v3 [Brachypodium distachyon]